MWTLALSLALATSAAAQAGSPAGPVPVERLIGRRAALLERLGDGVAVVPAAKLRSIEGDYPQDSDYRESNDFFYLTGLEAPGARLVLVARRNGPDSTILYLPEPESGPSRWTGGSLAPGPELSRLTGIADLRPVPSDSSRLVVRRRGLEPIPVHQVAAELAALRQIKDGDEVGRLRKAVAITSEALLEAMARTKPGMYEYELEAAIEYGFRRRGAERVGFPSIVGSGPNGTILHYDENRRQMEEGELVVIDVGAEYGYYSADLTRTLPVSGQFTLRQRRLYDLVLGAQQTAIDSIRPGTSLGALNQIARLYLRTRSSDLCGGLGCDQYFIHGLSHWLGMDVHDPGSYSRRLEPGMVLTVEPGIYIPAESLGIRIEDVVLVTREGGEVLSSGLPRSAEAVESAMAQ
ncbi:MAG TPA: aminopeptidase P N-terminal domain-containing protein [Gemmatimonadales bacterium]|jgi:Xaa-Pro aminopeptidase